MNDYADLEYSKDNSHRMENCHNEITAQENEFDYTKYCRMQKFNLKNEISKEKSIQKYFKEKYKIDDAEITDETLKNFLNKTSKVLAILPNKTADSTVIL